MLYFSLPIYSRRVIQQASYLTSQSLSAYMLTGVNNSTPMSRWEDSIRVQLTTTIAKLLISYYVISHIYVKINKYSQVRPINMPERLSHLGNELGRLSCWDPTFFFLILESSNSINACVYWLFGFCLLIYFLLLVRINKVQESMFVYVVGLGSFYFTSLKEFKFSLMIKRFYLERDELEMKIKYRKR